MKTIAFVGFDGLKQQQDDIAWRLPPLDFKVVSSSDDADVLLVAHHRLEFAPQDKPWIAVWITGSNGRFQQIRQLKNQPLELLPYFHIDQSMPFLIETLNKLP